MCNLYAEVDAFDSLDNCAAWPFENYLQQLKKKAEEDTILQPSY